MLHGHIILNSFVLFACLTESQFIVKCYDFPTKSFFKFQLIHVVVSRCW